MSLATQFDLTREALIEHFRQRIQQGQRTKLTKDELGQLALHFVDRLKTLKTEVEVRALCQAEITLLEEGYPQSSIGSQYLPVYRRLIQEGIDAGTLPLTETTSRRIQWMKRNTGEVGETQEHYALTYLKYDQATYNKLRQVTTEANNQRQDHLQAVPLEGYLDQAKELLHSDEPETLAIAIAAVTGRRHTDVVAKGQFNQTSYPYLLRFEGQQKDPTPPFDILTLVPAGEVLEVINRFRAKPSIQKLKGLGHNHKDIDAFNSRVNRRVSKLFGDIVPVLEGFKTVSVHRLRGVYGAITIHFFCPQMQHEHRFLQHYLGHLLDDQQGLPNAGATQHYFHYRLVNQQGEMLNARGVKVMANGLPPVPTDEQPLEARKEHDSKADRDRSQPIEAVSGSAATVTPLDLPTPERSRKHNSIRIYAEEHNAWVAVLGQVCPDCLNQQQKMSALLQRVKADLKGKLPAKAVARVEETPAPEVNLADPVMTQTVADQARTLAWLTGEVESLRQQVGTLQQQREDMSNRLSETTTSEDQQIDQTQPQLQQLQQEVDQLRAENVELSELLQRHKAALQAFVGEGGLLDTPVKGSGASALDVAPTRTDSAPPTPTNPPSGPPSRPRKSGGAKQRAMGIFLAIQQWNRQHPDNTFAVTPGLLEQTFGIHRKALKEFVAENQHLIWQHHQEVGVENERGHNRGKDVGELKAFVQQQR